MITDQYRLVWSSLSRSKKAKDVRGTKWFRIACHLVYTWLIPWGDDDGRLRGEPFWIQANILPNEQLNFSEIDKILAELNRVGLIIRYEVNEELFIQIIDWEKHQKIRKDRYKPSTYPVWQPIDNQLTTNCPQICNPLPTPSPTPSPTPTHTKFGCVFCIFEFYCQTMNKNPEQYKLTDKKKTKIIARLKDCRPIEIYKAIIACKDSDFHQGNNDKSKKYNDLLTNIIPNRDKVEWWNDKFAIIEPGIEGGFML